MQTFAERKGNEYVINGTKQFISNGGIAKLYLLHTRNRQEIAPQSMSKYLFGHPRHAGFFDWEVSQ